MERELTGNEDAAVLYVYNDLYNNFMIISEFFQSKLKIKIFLSPTLFNISSVCLSLCNSIIYKYHYSSRRLIV